MTQPLIKEPAPERSRPLVHQLERALETGCAVLIVLESTRERSGVLAGELAAAQQQVVQTVELVRGAIAELRLAQDDRANMLAFGFVFANGDSAPLR